MNILIFLFLFTLSCFLPRSRKLTIIIMLYGWILFGWNYSNGDYKAYEGIYNNAASLENYEVGFQFLVNISKSFGLNFQQFLIGISLIIVVLWTRFIYFLSNFPAFFSAIFLIIFLPLDFVLIRNSLAFSIIMQGLIFLFKEGGSVKKTGYFIFFVICASLIHKTSLFYLVLIPLIFYKEIKFYKILIITILSLIFYLSIGKVYLYSLLQDSGERSIIYQSNFITFLALVVYQLLGTYFIYLLSKVKKVDDKISILLKINYLMLLVFVLYYDFAIFVRLYRNIAIVNVIFAINIIFGYKFDKNYRFLLIIYLLFILYFMYTYFILPFQESTIEALFYKNLLIN